MVLVRFLFLLYYSFKRIWIFYIVEFDEFAKVMGSVYERKFSDDEMRRAFKCFDTDDSGE